MDIFLANCINGEYRPRSTAPRQTLSSRPDMYSQILLNIYWNTVNGQSPVQANDRSSSLPQRPTTPYIKTNTCVDKTNIYELCVTAWLAVNWNLIPNSVFGYNNFYNLKLFVMYERRRRH